jgi:hypothetical protein
VNQETVLMILYNDLSSTLNSFWTITLSRLEYFGNGLALIVAVKMTCMAFNRLGVVAFHFYTKYVPKHVFTSTNANALYFGQP